jgi:hypothetical protein
MVYVATVAGIKPKRVKIGYATNVESRIQVLTDQGRLASGNPKFSLYCLASAEGSIKDEKALQSSLAWLRIRGCKEWFELTATIEELIQHFNSGKTAKDALKSLIQNGGTPASSYSELIRSCDGAMGGS